MDAAQEDECEQHQELADCLDLARTHLNVVAGTGPSTPGMSFDDEFEALGEQLRLASMKLQIFEILLPESVDVIAAMADLSYLTMAVAGLDALRRPAMTDPGLIVRVRDQVLPVFAKLLISLQRLRASRNCPSFEDAAKSIRVMGPRSIGPLPKPSE